MIKTRSLLQGVMCALLVPAAAMAQSPNETRQELADGRGNFARHMPPRAAAGAVVTGNGISYHNGPVMRNGVKVYYIWYGNWAQDAAANAILTDLAKNIGGSPYFAVNTSYGDTVGGVLNTVAYVGSTADTGSLGTSLTDASIWTLVSGAISTGKLPSDPNGVYFVLTAPFVAETSGFLSQYCGWHNYNTLNSVAIKYAFVGHPAANLGACGAQSTSPNGDAGADAMASVIAHEMEESATDPQLTAWYDSTGAENADKCAWNFGAGYNVANGSKANMKLGTRNFLIQQNWLNANGGICALSYNSTPDFNLSVSPASQTVNPGAVSQAYTMTAAALNGWAGTLRYSVTAGLPSGATAHVSGNAITIGTTAAVSPGSYNFTISASSGTLTHATNATLVVNKPSFSLSISPSLQTVVRPGTGSVTTTYAVTVTAVNGFSGAVLLTATVLPTGETLAFSPATVVGAGKSTLAATVTSSAKKGNSSKFTVTGTSGSLTSSVTASLQVN